MRPIERPIAESFSIGLSYTAFATPVVQPRLDRED
jgi:hypothetical protein